MSNRVMTGLVFTIAMLIVIIPAFVWPWWTMIFLVVLAVIMTLEYHQAMQRIFKPLSLPLMLAASLSIVVPGVIWYIYRDAHRGWQFLQKTELQSPDLATWRTDSLFLLASGVAILFTYLFFLMVISSTFTVLKHGPARLPQNAAALSAGIYLGVPLASITLFLFALPNGFRWLLPAIFIPWISDVGAYYAGTYMGKKPFFNKISPNKTMEGAMGGILAGALIGGIYFLVAFRGDGMTMQSTAIALAYGLLSGALLAFAGEMGDLFASALKRWTGIKDFSHALPGHGGFLDRFDSVLFSLPVSIILASIFYLI